VWQVTAGLAALNRVASCCGIGRIKPLSCLCDSNRFKSCSLLPKIIRQEVNYNYLFLCLFSAKTVTAIAEIRTKM
jgi:hypothetical protein